MHRHYDRLLDDFMADNERHEKEARDQLMRTIRQLPVSETTAEEMKKKEECAICIGEFEEKEKIMTLPCFHRYGVIIWGSVLMLCLLSCLIECEMTK